MFKLSFKSFLLPLSLYIFTYLIPQMVLFHSFLDDNIYVTTRKKKARRGGAQSMVTILKREFPDGNFQSLFEGSSRVVGVPSSSSSIAADPLLSSFISAMAADKLFISEASLCGEETGSAKKTSNQSLPERYLLPHYTFEYSHCIAI